MESLETQSKNVLKKKILFITGFVEQRCQACCIVVTKRELSLTKKIIFSEKLLFLGAIKCDDKSHTEIVALSRILSLGREV